MFGGCFQKLPFETASKRTSYFEHVTYPAKQESHVPKLKALDSESSSANLANQPDGMYFIIIQNRNQTLVKQAIK